jgi:hypothetical protein
MMDLRENSQLTPTGNIGMADLVQRLRLTRQGTPTATQKLNCE